MSARPAGLAYCGDGAGTRSGMALPLARISGFLLMHPQWFQSHDFIISVG